MHRTLHYRHLRLLPCVLILIIQLHHLSRLRTQLLIALIGASPVVVYLHEAGRGGGAFFFVLFGLGIDLFHLFGILIIMIVIISIMKTRRIRIRRRFIFLSSLSSPKILISVLALLTRYRPQVNLHRGAFSTGLAHFRCQFSSVACVGLPALLIEGEGLGGDSVLSAV